MSACLACGHDPLATVTARWSFFVPYRVESANSRTVNSGAARWRYAKTRDGWQSMIAHAMRINGVAKATGKRRLVLTRLYSARQREFDQDNFIGAAKPCLDAMVRSGLLVDDNSRFLECEYRQERSEQSGLNVSIWEV